MLNCIAIDDEPFPLEIIQSYCERIDFLNLQKTFTNVQLAEKYLDSHPIDLVFLDIQMPSKSGLDIAKALHRQKMVIFTTAFNEYAVAGFEVNAIDYLLKPFSFERFKMGVTKAKSWHEVNLKSVDTAKDYFTVRADYSLVKINFAEIEYIESIGDYLKIFQTDKKMIIARMTLKEIVELLPSKDFCRVHRSFIIPISKIIKVRNKIVYLETKEIPIGSTFEKEFLDLYGR